jgi:hypothetical protein
MNGYICSIAALLCLALLSTASSTNANSARGDDTACAEIAGKGTPSDTSTANDQPSDAETQAETTTTAPLESDPSEQSDIDDMSQPTSAEDVPELPYVTDSNGKRLVYGSKTPRLFLFMHSKEEVQPIKDQVTLFRKESVRYDPNVVFLLVDLDDKAGKGEEFWKALLKTDPPLTPILVAF